MEDFVLSNLYQSRDEWSMRLISIITPLVIEGVKSIFNEAWKMCDDNNENPKYLMTFQNLLSRIPRWNSVIIEDEKKRIIERSGCGYLDDLIACVYIIQLKVLTCVRVGNKQKTIDISIPKLDHFIHKVYIHVARKVYMNVYLFEKNISPLQVQKNFRELEQIVQECILNTIRESIPTEQIIRAYMDESVEHEETVTIEHIDEPVLDDDKSNEKSNEDTKIDESKMPEAEEDVVPSVVPSIQNINEDNVVTKLQFNDIDSVLDTANKVESVNAPKTIERLEDIATSRAIQRKLEEEDENQDRIKIMMDDIKLSDIFDIDKSSDSPMEDLSLLDFEELE